ncbi:MAG: PIN domain-containing protein [bacterium]|nr:PIN domain-containing protein [bacterium]
MIGQTLFVDASAWVAAIDASDGLHAPAQRFWAESRDSRRRFLTSYYVLDETCTLLRRRRNGLRMAIAMHELVQSSRIIEVASITEELCDQAWELFVGYHDKVLSFTDCTSFALMRERQLLEAFTFDDDFRRAGFIVRPGT